MLYIVTGGAGFIGSNIVAEIERRNKDDDIVIVDNLNADGRWRNIAHRHSIRSIVTTGEFPGALESFKTRRDVAIIHMGAISSTREHDAGALVQNNGMLTTALFGFCAKAGWSFVYASSAQVYGTSQGQLDDDEMLLSPITAYGWSKAFADRAIVSCGAAVARPPIWAGLRFFNVFGPMEDHKGDDKSFVTKCFDAIRANEPIKVFRGSENFLRDWVCVDDCARLAVDIASGVRPVRGIFNVGSGVATSFIDVAKTCIEASQKITKLDVAPFPAALNGAYQAYTCANTSKLLKVAKDFKFRPFADAVTDLWQRSASYDGMRRFL